MRVTTELTMFWIHIGSRVYFLKFIFCELKISVRVGDTGTLIAI